MDHLSPLVTSTGFVIRRESLSLNISRLSDRQVALLHLRHLRDIADKSNGLKIDVEGEEYARLVTKEAAKLATFLKRRTHDHAMWIFKEQTVSGYVMIADGVVVDDFSMTNDTRIVELVDGPHDGMLYLACRWLEVVRIPAADGTKAAYARVCDRRHMVHIPPIG